ncbi:MAG: SDR family oxidoreductase [Saprospiraceae bacterium]|nr:SDR family oxidoreductase [Saprospiraceae bacterium]
MSLIQKNIVIIGGTTGMGLSAALSLTHQGAKVVVIGRNIDTCQIAEEKLAGKGIVLSADATLEESAKEAIEACEMKWGPLSGLYHVAGGSGRRFGDGPLDELTLEGWQTTFDLNLTALMLSNQAAIRTFLRHGQGGVILNMGSVLGFSPSPIFFATHAYAAAKSAVIGFSKSIAAYYAKDNIRVNVLAPGLVETPMAQRAAKDDQIQRFIKTKQPLGGGRIGRPEDLDGAVVYLLSDQSAFVTGQVLTVDGGWCISEGQH